MIPDLCSGGPLFNCQISVKWPCFILSKTQQQVHVPREGETNPPPAVSGGDAGSAESSGGLININTATAKGLEAWAR